MAFKFHKYLNGHVNPQFEEGTAGGTIAEGDLVKKSSASVIRATAASDALLFVAMNDAVSGGKVLLMPLLPGIVFEVPCENTAYVDATHKYALIDAYAADNIVDSVDPGASAQDTFMCLGLKDGQSAGSGAVVLVTPMLPFSA